MKQKTGKLIVLCMLVSSMPLYIQTSGAGEVRSCLSTEPINLGVIKQQIRDYRSSGAWNLAIECVAHLAINELRTYTRVKNRKRLAVIFDLDDTLLSNWDIMLRSDFGYNRELFKYWEQLGKSKLILPIRDVFYTALELSMSVFGITGRREDQREATERNLNDLGLVGWTAIYFKPKDYKKSTITEYKALRRKEIQDKGYEIIVNIGDQMSDFTGDPQAKVNFKLPNPMYQIP